MKQASYTNYAMRALRLSALRSLEIVRNEGLAPIHNSSWPYIMKMVPEPAKAGCLETLYERNSGFRLASAPKEIIVENVVRRAERPLDVFACFNRKKNTRPEVTRA